MSDLHPYRCLVGIVVVCTLVVQCKKASEPPIFPDITFSDAFEPVGAGIGDGCTTTSECRVGLQCEQGACEAAGTSVVGQQCTVTAECVDDAYCGPILRCNAGPAKQCEGPEDCISEEFPNADCILTPVIQCQPGGAGEAGEPCWLDKDCKGGLFCDRVGLVGACAEGGETDWGESCTKNSDCYAGLVCAGEGEDTSCRTLTEGLALAASWDGVECDAISDENPRVHFEVPGSKPLSEFYRLPFPNDIRLGSDMTKAHPAPGKGVLDFDPVARVLEAAADGMDGFGTSPTVFFRFSTRLDFDSVDYTNDDTPANLQLMNIDQESAQYKQGKGYVWAASDGKQKFLCNNWLLLRNGGSDLLLPKTTYAAIIFKGMKTCHEDDEGGGCNGSSPEFAADADMVALLAAEAPADSRLTAAWEKYAKLRQYLVDAELPASSVVAAAVFTTTDTTRIIRQARAAARTLPVPAVTEAVLCDAGVTSPCADDEDDRRVCPAASPAFHEIHGKLTLPVFQEGTAPYLEPSDGGDIKLAATGILQVDHTEDVCFSLTVPKEGVVPEGGWPVVIVSHGTGGMFRSPVLSGTALTLTKAQANLSGGGMAVLTIDAAMHGPRRNSELPPDVLFFNIANPKAARGNVYQGAIDNFSLVHWIEGQTGDIAGVAGTKLDPARIGYLGHSQGATVGPLFLAYEPSVGAAVLSGAGAGLNESLMNKTSPVDIPAGLALVLREPGGINHPAISLLQQFFDPVDNANYGQLLTKTPPEGVKPAHNLMVIYGRGDTYTPSQTTRLLADVLNLTIAEPAIDVAKGEPFSGYQALGEADPETDKVAPAPFKGNVEINGDAVTVGLTMYEPEDYDGHFVLTRHDDAKAQVSHFFASFFRTGEAEIPER